MEKKIMKYYDKESLKTIFASNMYPILFENITPSIFDNYVTLDKNCDISELNGHYEGINFLPPKWYEELLAKSTEPYCILIIEDINKLASFEQEKFNELLKYRKISTFDLPSNCRIVLICNDLNNYPLSNEVYSLVAHV